MHHFHVQPESPPLREDAAGAIRIGKTRVLLELVVRAFQDGATPAEIVQTYTTLSLSDAYAVIAYYLRHREEVDEYVARCEQAGQEIRRRIEASQPDLSEIRARIQARRASRE